MYYIIYSNILYACTFLIPIIILVKYRKEHIYHIIAVYMSFGIAYEFNFKDYISLQQLLVLMLSIQYFLKLNIRVTGSSLVANVDKSNDITKYSLLLAIYAAVVTILFYFPVKDYMLVGGLLRNELRPLVQSIQFVMIYIAFIAVLKISSDQAIRLIKIFVRATIFFAILGITQCLVNYFFNFDLFPMNKDTVIYGGVSLISKTGFLKITALVGEPKHYSKFMNFGLAFLLLSPKLIALKSKRFFCIILIIIAIILSASTTGYIMMGFAFIIYIIKKASKNMVFIVPGIILITLIPLVLFNLPVVTDKLSYGTNAGGEIIGLENTDTAAVRFLINEPKYLLTGNGIGNTVAYAYNYAPDQSSFIRYYPFTLRRGIIKMLVECGIIGVILQIIIFRNIYRKTIKDTETKFISIFIIITYWFLTCEAIIEYELFLLALLFASLTANITQNIPKTIK